jgi:hypothetical protein
VTITIYSVVKLIPTEVIDEALDRAATYEWAKERNRFGF